MDFVHDRRIRVFLSSTFADMQEERDYLVKNTFPAIKRQCKRRNVDFSVVDLRWGVTEEEAHTGKVIEICIDEIQHTRPFFIGLLGGRYGWVPEESDLQVNRRLANRFPWVKRCMRDGMSMTEMEIQYGVLNNPDPTHAHFFLRREHKVPSKFREVPGSAASEKLARLKQAIRDCAAEGRCQVTDYSTAKQLGKAVYQQLMLMLDQLYPLQASDPVALMCETQLALLHQLQKTYENRETMNELEETLQEAMIDLTTGTRRRKRALAQGVIKPDDIDSEEMVAETEEKVVEEEEEEHVGERHWCVLVSGGKGTGKSALAANWRKDDPYVVRTFLNNDTYTAADALAHLHAVAKERGLKGGSQLTWVIDGLEFLSSEEERTLTWLEKLDVNLLLTTDDEVMKHCVRSLADKRYEVLHTMDVRPPLVTEVVDICKAYLQQFAKGLSERQFIHIANHRQFANIRLLHIFLDELVQFGVFEHLDQFIDRYLQTDTTEELLEQVLIRLEGDYGSAAVRSFFGMLSLTSIGAPESTLQHATGLNTLDWSAFYTSVEQFVAISDGLIRINSDEMLHVAAQRYTTDEQRARQWRLTLAKAYEKQYRQMLARRTWWNKILYGVLNIVAGIPQFLGLPDELQRPAQRLATERLVLLIQAGKADKLLRRMSFTQALFLFSSSPESATMIFSKLSPSQWSQFVKNFGFGEVLFFHYTNTLSDMLMTLHAMIPFDNGDIIQKTHKRISRMWFLPSKIRRQTLAEIDAISHPVDTPIEDTWAQIPIEKFGGTKVTDFMGNNLIYIASMDRIDHIEECVDAVLQRAEKAHKADADDSMNEAVKSLFLCIKAYCLYRRGLYDEADDLFSRSMQQSAFIQLYAQFDYLFSSAVGDRQRSQACIRRLKQQVETMTPTGQNTNVRTIQFNQHVRLIYMQMSEAIIDEEDARFDALAQELMHLADSYPDLTDRDNQMNIVLYKAGFWLLIQGYHHQAAHLFETIAIEPVFSLSDSLDCYGWACREYKECERWGDIVRVGEKAVSLYRELVERGEMKPTAIHFDRLQEAYAKLGNDSLVRQVLEHQRDTYRQLGQNNNAIWAMGRIAESFKTQADKEIMLPRAQQLYRQGAEAYDELRETDTEEICGISCVVRRYNYAQLMGYGTVYYQAWTSSHPRVQQAADEALALLQRWQTDPEVQQAMGDMNYLLCLCLAAAGRYHDMEPYVAKCNSVDLGNLYYIHVKGTEEITRNYAELQARRYLEPWNRYDRKHTMPITLRKAAGWIYWQYDDLMMPVMQRIATDPADSLRTHAIAHLLLHAYLSEDSEQMVQTRQLANELIESSQLEEDDLYRLLLARKLVTFTLPYEGVYEAMMLQMLNEAEPEQAQHREDEDIIRRAEEFCEDKESWQNLEEHIPLLHEAIQAYRRKGESVPQYCYAFVFQSHREHSDWQAIIDTWPEVKADGLGEDVFLVESMAFSFFHIGRIDEGIRIYELCLARTERRIKELGGKYKNTEWKWDVSDELANEQENYCFLLCNLMRMSFLAGEEEGAIQRCKQLTQILKQKTENDKSDFNYWSAYVLAAAGRHVEALHRLELDMQMNEGDFVALRHNRMVHIYCCLRQGNVKDALRMYEKEPDPAECGVEYFLNCVMVELEWIRYYAALGDRALAQRHDKTLTAVLGQDPKRAPLFSRRIEEKEILLKSIKEQ